VRRGTVPSRVNVYLPDELARAVRETDIAISAVCQAALEQEVRRVQATKQASSDLEQVAARLKQTRTDKEERDYQQGYELGIRWAKEEATEAELEWAAETASENWFSMGHDPEESSLWRFLEVETDDDYSRGGDFERSPWLLGIFEGAAEVYRQVTPLL